MTSYEDSSRDEIEAVLDGMEEATAQEVYEATLQYSARALAAVAAARADAEVAPFNGGTITETLVIAAPTSGDVLQIQDVSEAPAGPFVLEFFGKGGLYLATNNPASDGFTVEPLNTPNAGKNIAGFWGASKRVLVSRNGFLKFSATTAPPDDELTATELAFWFDATNGAAKLMLKGKTANGTVVTGEVALA
jgi:hypothetical protein